MPHKFSSWKGGVRVFDSGDDRHVMPDGSVIYDGGDDSAPDHRWGSRTLDAGMDTAEDLEFLVRVEARPRSAVDAEESFEVGDIIYNPEYVYQDRQLIVYPSSFGPVGPVTYQSLAPEVAEVDGDGYVTHITDGVCPILVTSDRFSQRVELTFQRGPARIAWETVTFAESSLAEHVFEAMDARLDGEVEKPLFSTMNHAAGEYIRNVGCWAYGWDLTCASVWNSFSGQRRAGTLISPRHVLFASHSNYYVPPGHTIRFVTMDNEVVDRTISAVQSASGTDFTVGLLNGAVPEEITFAQILPQDWADYIPHLDSGQTQQGKLFPVLATDQEKKALVKAASHFSNYMAFGASSYAPHAAFDEPVISGDSGSPVMMIIGDAPVILTVWSFGGGGSGDSIMFYRDAVNNAMTALGGGYQLTEINLEEFVSWAT